MPGRGQKQDTNRSSDERQSANEPSSSPCFGGNADPHYLWGPGPAGDVRLKGVYDSTEVDDGARVLVDRLWPRGVKKSNAQMHLWLPEVAPSHELRRRFAHAAERWAEFVKLYKDELAERPEDLAPLVEIVQNGRLTLLFAAKDREHTHAIVLREVVLRRLETPSAGTAE